MRLNHIDLPVSDVQRTVGWFEQLFDFQLRSSRSSPAIAILNDGHGFVLVLQRRRNPAEAYPEGFHIGFVVEDVDTVQRFHTRARAASLEVSDIQRNNHGTQVYWKTPEGFLIEVSCRGPRGS
jgi:catechol 2,3-dioxygenase-like lactoylglutathione lyase family enzyme